MTKQKFNIPVIFGILLIIIIIGSVYHYNIDYFKTQYIKTMEFFGIVGCLSNVDINGVNFCQIGNGPAIDRNAMYNWLGTGSSSYINHEGINLFINSTQYRAINGFIPPSFSYFPYGLDVDNYRPEDDSISVLDPNKADYNTDEGREMCMQACKDTNCKAVQTEVPQMCYEKRINVQIPEGLGILGGSGDETIYTTKGDCKGKATHSCTLFYNSVELADDAYFDLSGGVITDNSIPFKVGIKYYENNRAPGITPGDGNTKPSEENVKWCKPNVTNINSVYTKYKTNIGDPICTCEQGDLTCDDSNCCIYRDLITSEWAKHNTPYYNLPLNVTKTAEINDGSPASICPAKDNNNQCCGYCSDGKGGWMIKSCPQNKQYLDGTLKNPLNQGVWWATDTKRAQCMWPSEPWWTNLNPVMWVSNLINEYNGTRKDMDECLEEYAALKNDNPEEAYRVLTGCCGYLDQACVDTVAQPFCTRGKGDINRGCFGDPTILTVDNVGEISACDNPAVIAPENRCIKDYEGKGCTGFPYACETGPLWIIQ